MKTASLIALKAFPYDGEDLKVGDTFPALEEHAKILCLLGQAERNPEPQTAAATPEPPAPAKPSAPVVINEQVAAVSPPPWASSKKSSKKTSE